MEFIHIIFQGIIGINIMLKTRRVTKHQMRKKKLKKFLKAGFVIIPYFYLGVFLMLLVESFTYIGFIKKHFFIDSSYIFIFSIVIAITYLFVKRSGEEKLLQRFFKVNKIIFSTTILSSFILFIIEYANFPNYIFSKIHVNIDNISRIIFLSSALWLIDWLRTKSKTMSKKSYLITSLSFLLIFFSLFSLLDKTFKEALEKNVYVIKNINDNYDQKMLKQWGIFYSYMMFVKNNTEEDSTMLIPPQTWTWYKTGNVGLVRYFLYPRKLGNGDYDKLPDLKNYDYIFLAWGELPNGNKDDYGWPKVKIDSEKIIYWDEKSNSVKAVNSKYDPADKENYKAWGIIKVKK